jgi:hypothetical protein
VVDHEDCTLSLNRKVLGSQRHAKRGTMFDLEPNTLDEVTSSRVHAESCPTAIPYVVSNSQSSAKCKMHLWNSNVKRAMCRVRVGVGIGHYWILNLTLSRMGEHMVS